MKPVRFAAGTGKSDCSFRVALPGRYAQMIAVLPERPANLRLALTEANLKPGGTLEYRMEMFGEADRPARGSHLLEVEVTGPDGEIVSRFGGATATSKGVATREMPVPVNALPGEYRVVAVAPQAGAQAEARFTIAK